eukprot:6486418-Amphidinium_carterae.1
MVVPNRLETHPLPGYRLTPPHQLDGVWVPFPDRLRHRSQACRPQAHGYQEYGQLVCLHGYLTMGTRPWVPDH